MRSRTSLVQTIGRSARNVDGKAILYADKITDSMQYAIDETQRRREKQMAHNTQHGITPQSVKKALSKAFDHMQTKDKVAKGNALHDDVISEFLHNPAKMRKHIDKLKKKMITAAGDLEFETAARLRDEIKVLEDRELGV